MGGVDPSGEAGGVLAALLGDEGYPAGRLIMMLRVTFIGASPPLAGVVGGITVAASGVTSERPNATKNNTTASQIDDTKIWLGLTICRFLAGSGHR